jgi:hypothetical protein
LKNVTSREYKVMLRAKRFAGDQRALVRAAAAFWDDFSRDASDIARRLDGNLGTIGRRRLITFFDTADRLLFDNDYIFRERRDLKTREREVTLKFRHEDRHFTQSRDMTPRRAKGARTKFEEDIKPRFTSLFSYSTTVPVDKRWSPRTLRDVRRLFPDVPARLDEYPDDEALAPVGGFTARELVLGGATIRIGKSPKVDAESALIVWYDEGDRGKGPVAVEFSFRYGNKHEEYAGAVTRRAFDIFTQMPASLDAWVDSRSQTKTRFVYA